MKNKIILLFKKIANLKGVMKFIVTCVIAIVSLAGVAASAIGIFLSTTPRPTNIRECFTTELFKVHLCPTSQSYTRLRNITPYLRNAVIVSEDANFYNHKGIDWFELRESFNTNLKKGEYVRGGSTITQQLAKNLYLTSEKSILRKLREAVIAVQIEGILSKDEILEKYLNVVEFGENIFGVRQAASHYFKKAPSQLSVAESAFLAFLLPSPKSYSVSFKRKQLTPFARARMKLIVNRMWRYKKIDDFEYETALAEIDHFFQPPPELTEPEQPAESLETDESSEHGDSPAELPVQAEPPDIEDMPHPDPEEMGSEETDSD